MDLAALEALTLSDADGVPHRLGDLWATGPSSSSSFATSAD